MAITGVKHLRTKTAGRKPTAAQIEEGELAINLVDKKLFTKNGSTIIEVGGETTPLKNSIDVLNGKTKKLDANGDFNQLTRIKGDNPILRLEGGDSNWAYMDYQDTRHSGGEAGFRTAFDPTGGWWGVQYVDQNWTRHFSTSLMLSGHGQMNLHNSQFSPSVAPYLALNNASAGINRTRFQQDSDGQLRIYRATTGQEDWSSPFSVGHKNVGISNLATAGWVYHNDCEYASQTHGGLIRYEFHKPGVVGYMFAGYDSEFQITQSTGSGGVHHYLAAFRQSVHGYTTQFPAAAYATGGFHTGSDERYKNNIVKFNPNTRSESSLDKVNKLETYNFKYNQAEECRTEAKTNYGFIAQQVEAVLPEAVADVQEPCTMDEDGNEVVSTEYRKHIDPMAIIALQTEAIKELTKRLEELEDKVKLAA